MLCPVYGHELTPLSCPPPQGVRVRSFKGLTILSPYKSRWADNIMIERWFRSFKYEEAYLTQYNNIREAREAIRIYVKKYNFERCHSAIGGVPPALVYYPAMLLEAARAAS